MGVSEKIPDGPSALGMTENLNPSFPAGKAGVGNLLLYSRTTKKQQFMNGCKRKDPRRPFGPNFVITYAVSRKV